MLQLQEPTMKQMRLATRHVHTSGKQLAAASQRFHSFAHSEDTAADHAIISGHMMDCQHKAKIRVA